MVSSHHNSNRGGGSSFSQQRGGMNNNSIAISSLCKKYQIYDTFLSEKSLNFPYIIRKVPLFLIIRMISYINRQKATKNSSKKIEEKI